jgi:hypothetical protein
MAFCCCLTVLVYDLFVTLKSKRFDEKSGSKNYYIYYAVAYSFPMFVSLGTFFVETVGFVGDEFDPDVANTCFSLFGDSLRSEFFYIIFPASIVVSVGTIITVISLMLVALRKFRGDSLPDDVSNR